MQDPLEFSKLAIKIMKRIPKGRVASYGQIATLSGNPRAARQVVRLLHSRSKSDKLPWHRIINKQGYIALRPGTGFEEQRMLLAREGIETTEQGRVDLAKYLWRPRTSRSSATKPR